MIFLSKDIVRPLIDTMLITYLGFIFSENQKVALRFVALNSNIDDSFTFLLSAPHYYPCYIKCVQFDAPNNAYYTDENVH